MRGRGPDPNQAGQVVHQAKVRMQQGAGWVHETLTSYESMSSSHFLKSTTKEVPLVARVASTPRLPNMTSPAHDGPVHPCPGRERWGVCVCVCNRKTAGMWAAGVWAGNEAGARCAAGLCWEGDGRGCRLVVAKLRPKHRMGG